MSKDTYIRTRLSEKTKHDFDALCASSGIAASEQLRLMIEAFVAADNEDIESRVAVRIYRPEGYDYGVWRATATLRSPSDGLWFGTPIPFALPELANRLIRSDPEFRAIANSSVGGSVIGGRFDNGEWRGEVSTNGCEEANNPTEISAVKEALETVIEQMLEKFHGYARITEKRNRLREQAKNIEVINSWIREGKVWTKNPRTATSGLSPGIYGRNVVVGFCDSVFGDDSLFVISRYAQAGPKSNQDEHYLYVTNFLDWMQHMVPVNSEVEPNVG